MPFNKPHLEFLSLNPAEGWEPAPGYPPGTDIHQRILASDLDDENGTGSRTRLLRFGPGQFSTQPFVHRHWEEVYLASGDLVVGNDAEGNGGEKFEAPTYACRPPGVWHGPFKSEGGCLLIEFHYYDETNPYHEPQ
ncbi:MAG: cupin [Sphingomonadaceae bacterium]|nr:cupin [Sphingomonadaceae bacterium]